jgi:hypothetical protein
MSLFALVAMALVPAGSGKAVQDPWVGTYEYTFNAGKTAGGTPVVVEYTLVVRSGSGSGSATLKADGYQTSHELVCDTRNEGDRLEVAFKSYPDGGTTNEFGVELYKPGELLLTLEWRGAGAGRKLVTLWGAYNTDAPRPEAGAVQFKKVTNLPAG